MSRDYTGEEYYGPENGLVCWDCIPKLPRGRADNLAYAHVIWKFFCENFPGARISQEGKISVDDVEKILQGKLFHKQLLHLNKFSFEQTLESVSEEVSSAPIFNEAALKIGTKKFAAMQKSAIFKEMVQDGEIDYYEARRLVYSLSLTLNEANIKTDIKGTVYPRTGLTQSLTNNEMYHDWTNFVFREKNFYQDYWRIAASSGSGIDRRSIEQKWYPKIKREMAKVGLKMKLSANEYVNEVFRRYNIDQSDEDRNQRGYLDENATLNHHEAREWIYVFAEYITDDDLDSQIVESVALPIIMDELGDIESDATDASEIKSEIAISTLKRKEVTFKNEEQEATSKPIERFFDDDMTIIRRIIQKLNNDVVQKWKSELIEVQNLRCNNKLFAVRGEMYSLFGYTVMNKLMIMKSYWIGKMFNSLKILDVQLEALETYLVFLGSVIDKLDDEEFRSNLKTNHRLAKENMARQTKAISSDHCLSWWNEEKTEKPHRSHFYEEEDVLLNGDISFDRDTIIKNDTEKVNQLMAKIVIFMEKLCLKKMSLPENEKITNFEFKTDFGRRLAENLLTLRDVCFKDVNKRIENMDKYSRNKRKQLLKFQTIFKSAIQNAEEEQSQEFEISCLHNSPGFEIGVNFTPAIQEIENILHSSSFMMSPVAMGKKRYNY